MKTKKLNLGYGKYHKERKKERCVTCNELCWGKRCRPCFKRKPFGQLSRQNNNQDKIIIKTK